MFCINPSVKKRAKIGVILILASYVPGLGPFATGVPLPGTVPKKDLARNPEFYFKPLTSLHNHQPTETVPVWYWYGPKRPGKRHFLLLPATAKHQWCGLHPATVSQPFLNQLSA